MRCVARKKQKMKSRPKVIIADDNEQIRKSLTEVLLAQRYRVVEAANGEEALRKVQEESPDVVLLDIEMPRMNGIEVLKRLKSDKTYRHIPVVIVTGRDDVDLRVEALSLGADDILIKPPLLAELTARVRSLTKVKAYNDYMRYYRTILEDEVRQRTHELNEAHTKLRNASLDTIFRLSRAAEYKDEDTSVHIQRMSHYAAAIAREMCLDDERCEAIIDSSPMHDLGKIGVPDQILLKPGKLNEEEWEVMKRHTIFGAQILADSDSEFIKLGRTIALTHHEKWDGSGYPNRIAGDVIPIEGRVSAIADVFDALTTKRPYKKPFSNETALKILREETGTHFDPEVTNAFFKVKDTILEIQRNFARGGEA